MALGKTTLLGCALGVLVSLTSGYAAAEPEPKPELAAEPIGWHLVESVGFGLVWTEQPAAEAQASLARMKSYLEPLEQTHDLFAVTADETVLLIPMGRSNDVPPAGSTYVVDFQDPRKPVAYELVGVDRIYAIGARWYLTRRTDERGKKVLRLWSADGSSVPPSLSRLEVDLGRIAANENGTLAYVQDNKLVARDLVTGEPSDWLAAALQNALGPDFEVLEIGSAFAGRAIQVQYLTPLGRPARNGATTELNNAFVLQDPPHVHPLVGRSLARTWHTRTVTAAYYDDPERSSAVQRITLNDDAFEASPWGPDGHQVRDMLVDESVAIIDVPEPVYGLRSTQELVQVDDAGTIVRRVALPEGRSSNARWIATHWQWPADTTISTAARVVFD